MSERKGWRWTPVWLGLGLCGAGALGVAFAASGMKVTVEAPGETRDEVDPIVLLRDEVGVLQQDLGRLETGLGSNLESLAEALDGRAGDRHDTTRTSLASVRERIYQIELRQERILGRLEAMAARPVVQAAAPAPAHAAPAEASAEVVEEAPAVPEPEAIPAPEAAPEAEDEAARGLFTFRMEGGLDFGARLRFQVIPSLSRVGFDAKSTLHDFSGATQEVSGGLVAQLGAADSGAEGRVVARADTLRTGVEGRDEEMRKHLETETFPELSYQITGFETRSVDEAAKTLEGTAIGTFTIHGETREVRVPVRAEVDASRRLVLEGEVDLAMSAFGVEVPSVAGAIEVEDTVRVWLSLRLRSLGPAGE